MPEITPELIARLRELDAKASPAPWTEVGNPDNPDMPCLVEDANGELIAEGEPGWESFWFHIDDPVLIFLGLRNALPVLLDEIERLQAELRTAREEAWDEGYNDKDSEASESMIERGLRERATNPYKEQD